MFNVKIKGARRWFVFNKFKQRCAYCGNPIRYDHFEVDHILSKATFKAYRRLGKFPISPITGRPIHDINTIENLFPSCVSCNRLKKDLSIEDFRALLSNLREVLRNKTPAFKHAARFHLASTCNIPVEFCFENSTSYRYIGDLKLN
jgi:5-methylcytosine-specific restriction endonuclease McrA